MEAAAQAPAAAEPEPWLDLAAMCRVPCLATTHEERMARRVMWKQERGNRAVQLIVGNAIGDAFGFGIEMQDAAWIRENVQHFDTFPQNPVMDEEFRSNNVRGFYSDDAEMTIGLMKALAADGVALDKDRMMEAWKVEWDLAKERPPPAVPGGERQGHGGVKFYWRGPLTPERLADVRQRQAPEKRVDPGNAPPMRALPLAFLAPKHRERLSVENADSTHPHPKAQAASLLVAFAGRYLFDGRDKAELLSAAVQDLASSPLADEETLQHLRRLEMLPDYHTYCERFASMPIEIHEVLCGPQPCPFTTAVPAGADGKTPMHGLYADAMRTAGVVLYILQHERGPLDALKASVDMGGDVDSIAALVLGVIAATSGLRFGEEGGLPWALLENVEGVEYLIEEAKKFHSWLVAQPTDVTGRDESVPRAQSLVKPLQLDATRSKTAAPTLRRVLRNPVLKDGEMWKSSDE